MILRSELADHSIMAAASSSSSSSSSSSLPPKKHDVFLSFRGEDTRRSFTSHLHTALCQRGIRTYIDYELPKGDDISDALIGAIQDSSIAVVIFSQNYASSKWCLNELLQILWCREVQGQLVIPVFYQVDPSHVRHQRGTYREAFAKHERDFRLHQDQVNKWKQALFLTANLAGYDSRICRDESELTQNIVNNVLCNVNLTCPSSPLTDLVGIDENCAEIERLLEKAPIIGIWGMGGIGKTTMAKALFIKLSSKFEGRCFLENLREDVEKHGLTHVRDKLLFELLEEERSYHRPPNVAGSAFIKRRLSCKKVFIVLDDVSSWRQLEYLAPYCDHLGPGSKVIITTRDKQFLVIGKVNEIYEAQPLSGHKSAELLNLKAFDKYHPKIGYEFLSKRVVDYAKGIPLVLVVLGSFLRSKSPKEWDSALSKLKKSPNEDIFEVLKLSFNGLNHEEKEMFLDIAFFLKGETEDYVITILESYDFHARIGLKTLVDSTLISVEDGNVYMHNLIQEMAYEIVHQECIKEPGRRSRLHDPKEVYYVLKNNTGTDAIEGIVLDLSKLSHLTLSPDTFKKMPKLRFLKFYSPKDRRSCKVNLSSGLESLSEQLRYLQWDGYPLESLPSTFCPEKLVELCMQNSHIKKLWDGVQDFVNLRRINLARCKQLIELPDFSKAHNLESVNLSSCESLCYVHPSILALQRLVTLDLNRCIKLKNLHSEIHLQSLRRLYVSWCFSLTEFSLSSHEIASLELETTRIEILDSSIGHLSNLKQFRLNCSRLKNLPINELCCLRSLEELGLFNCEQAIDKVKLHILFDALRLLEILCLDGCQKLTELPDNIKHLSGLKALSLKNCERLQSLPELPPSIEELDATNCPSLEALVLISEMESSTSPEEGMMALTPYSSTGYLSKLRKLRLNVSSLKNFSIEQLCCLRSLKELSLFDCGEVIDKSKLRMLFDALSSLVDLYLEGCSDLDELPDNLSSLSLLYLLGLEGSNVKYLASSIKHLPRLDYIYLTNCRTLRSLPELPPFTRYVKATNCSSLQAVSLLKNPRQRQKYLVESLFLENCLKLEHHSLSRIEEHACLSLKRGAYLNRTGAFCFPGSQIPEWVRYSQTIKASSFITIELSSVANNLVGFVFCSVLPQFTSKPNCQSYLKCQMQLEDGERVDNISDDMRITNLNSHHVFLWYDPIHSVCLLRELIQREEDQGIKGNSKLSFEFSVVSYDENYEITEHDGLIEECGVCPIYASEYHNFLQQMEFGLELGGQERSGHDNDQDSQSGIMEYASSCLKQAIYDNLERSMISFPKTTIPKWFTYHNSTEYSSISVSIAPNLDDLLGFIFCFVIPQFCSKEKDQSHSGCRCRWPSPDTFHTERVSTVDRGFEGPRGWHYSMTRLNSDNSFLWYDPLFCELIIEEVRRKRGIDERTSNYNPTLSFEFEFGDRLIKECGVRPIYASEYNDFLQLKELKMKQGMKTKRPRDTWDGDEDEQLTPAKKLKESCVIQPEKIDHLTWNKSAARAAIMIGGTYSSVISKISVIYPRWTSNTLLKNMSLTKCKYNEPLVPILIIILYHLREVKFGLKLPWNNLPSFWISKATSIISTEVGRATISDANAHHLLHDILQRLSYDFSLYSEFYNRSWYQSSDHLKQWRKSTGSSQSSLSKTPSKVMISASQGDIVTFTHLITVRLEEHNNLL
ncbi:disease resistance protein RUN1-like [Prosopis cineraria]|uniref:disease resistance protein RUN1-like n=1 Tax=Prosopis cineraria TaxID=364024 RepID=UPI002410335B|nr:disease resistance protein RUN1-like [Prosopis cineraria]